MNYDKTLPIIDRARSHPDSCRGATRSGASHSQAKGWFLAGSHPNDYITGIDSEVVYNKAVSGFLKSKAEKNKIDGFGTLMQSFNPGNYRNQRLRMSAHVKSRDIVDWAGLWLRVDDLVGDEPLSFDNMSDRPIKGTTKWQQYDVVLDVPEESTNIAFGILLSDTGQVWVDEFKFEVVGQDIAVTGTPDYIISSCTEAIKLNPSDATAFYQRAGAYLQAKNYEQAVVDCNEAIHLKPDYAKAFSLRGRIYLDQGHYEEGIRDYNESIRLNPENPIAYYEIACAYSLHKDLEASLDALRRCFELGDCSYYRQLVSNDSDFDFVRNDPRFHALLIEFVEEKGT